MISKQTPAFRQCLKNLDYVVAVVIFRSIEKLEKGNISKLARSAKVERRSVYNMFKKGSNPTFRNVASISQNLGVNINLSLSSACN